MHQLVLSLHKSGPCIEVASHKLIKETTCKKPQTGDENSLTQ